jgi:AraC family transcriptional regulator, transcriptional activator of pobA
VDTSIRIDSIAQIHQMLGRPPPSHPHLAVLAASWQEPVPIPALPIVGVSIESALYVVSLKRGDECGLEFGRQSYDGQAGSIVFLAPGQAMKPLKSESELVTTEEAWTLAFHPDLLRDLPLAETMHRYRFFDYATHEALHLEVSERQQLTRIVRQLETETTSLPDAFARDILTAHLQILLSYCQRAYQRQFDTRCQATGRVAQRLARHLDEHFSERPSKGLPTVGACARALGYSPDYLSDLLRAETGANTRAHIHRALIDAAKARLLSATASEVAYALGFEHPQHLARLFRQKTGHTPGQWIKRHRSAKGESE